MISASGAPNAGLILDGWHWHRAGTAGGAPGGDLQDILDLDAAEVYGVQLSDALPVPHADLRHEGRHLRVLPGQGAADLAGFVRAVQAIGVTMPFAVEVLSDELDAKHPVEAGRMAAEAAHAVLALSPASALR